MHEAVAPIVYTVPLQLLAYHVAVLKGTDVDQPRNPRQVRHGRIDPLDVTHILDGLNERQREAVTAPVGNLLVVAGAGSGKTRVLVHRIAWLVEAEGASPHSVLAVTFTNKAAAEMRSRTETLLDVSPRAMWVGTFHGIAHRLLRMHWEDAGLPQNFQIIDADDQQRVVAAHPAHARTRRAAVAVAPGVLVHQRPEGRGPARERSGHGRRPLPRHPEENLRGV